MSRASRSPAGGAGSWLRLPGRLPDAAAGETDWDARAAVRSFYAFLDGMPADERIPFALRKLAGLGLEETAAACASPLHLAAPPGAGRTTLHGLARGPPDAGPLAGRRSRDLNTWRRIPWNELRALIDEANAPFVDDEVALRRARALLLAPTAARVRAQRPRAGSRSRGSLPPRPLPSRGPRPVARPGAHPQLRDLRRGAVGGLTGPPWPRRQTATDVTFSDGSRVTIAPGGTGDVDTTAAAVTVRLHAGTLRAHVVHRERASWRFVAGPFDVRVTGTRFETGWDEARGQFTLSLAEGGVVVSGPLLGDAGQAVRPARPCGSPSPTARCRGDSTAGAAAASPSGALTAGSPAPRRRVHRPSRARPRRRTPAAVAPAPAPGWQELARAERHDEALGLALAAGYATVLETASATELLLLADSARLARAPERARAALMAVRTRFPNSPQAASARFGLARLAFDVDGDLTEAAADFQAYLDEAPSGPLAREAAGRLLEARVRLGDHDAAARAARGYLDRFPDGPRADLARRLLP